jgi:membrane peptidoglycan carboxypeptidase
MTSGASTITQQLVRTLAYTEKELLHQRTNDKARFNRKTVEIPLAILYEKALEKALGSKERAKEYVLKQFLDSMYFGKNTIGIKAAAQAFFGKSVHNLTLAESAALVGLLQQPGIYSTDPKIAAGRAQTVIALMKQRKGEAEILGKSYDISEKELEEAEDVLRSNEPLRWISADQTEFTKADGTTWHFSEELLTQISALDRERGVTIHSTLDNRFQQTAWHTIRNMIDSWRNTDNLPHLNAAMLIIDPKTGSIKAHIANTRNFFDSADGSGYQDALHREPRSAGSTLKPILAAAAMQYNGATSDTKLSDEAYKYKNGKMIPENYNSHVWPGGTPSLRQALANSLNRPMVRLIGQTVGIERFSRMCARLGISSIEKRLHSQPDDLDEGMAIGSVDVRLLDLAKAYIPIYNGGLQVGLRYIDSVSDRGKVMPQPLVDSQQVISPGVAREVFDILADPKARDWGFGPRTWLKSLGIDEQVAFKTGTSTNYTDSWIVAFDKQTGLMFATWVGNPNRSPLPNNYSGANRAGKLTGTMIQQIRSLKKYNEQDDKVFKKV